MGAKRRGDLDFHLQISAEYFYCAVAGVSAGAAATGHGAGDSVHRHAAAKW